MYYVVNTTGQTEGPYPSEWIRAHVTSSTLVSYGQQWIRYDAHPDFRLEPKAILSRVEDCSGCALARRAGLQFCTTCGRAITAGGTPITSPSPHLALLNVLLPGVAQIVFGQIAKGILMLLLHFVTFATVVIPLIIIVLSVIDGYKVGSKLRRTGAVGPWEFFPA